MKTPVLVVLCGFSSLAVSDTSVVDTPKADSLVERSRLVSTRPENVRPGTASPETNHPEKNLANSGSGAVLLPEKISAVSRFAFDSVRSAGQKPPLSLAEIYRADINVPEFLVSEKYDGARVWWNGRQLLSRGGIVYHAPAWFTNPLPDHVLDGELWIGRGQFQLLMQTIRDAHPDEQAWRSVRFMVFDAPTLTGGFRQRQTGLTLILAGQQAEWIQQVEQHDIANTLQLQQMLSEVVSQGGEGLILQRANAPYYPGRHGGFLKLKPYQDDEAIVVGYKPGKGKYTGMTGSLIVEDPQGRRFKLGSGLSDSDRQHPPAIGARVTYRYQGRTVSGKPRFARFLGVRPEE